MTPQQADPQPSPLQSVHIWLRWLAAGTAAGSVAGLAAALFAYLLRVVTQLRFTHLEIVYLLPVSGLVWGLIYERFGQQLEDGYSLVIDSLHKESLADDSRRLCWQLAPVVLLGTLITHLFGGSAGREGTAVQMGAGLADGVYRLLGRVGPDRSHWVMAGMAGGFGAMFGTPVSGALFALEAGTVGRLDYGAWVPCLTAAFVGDRVRRQILCPQQMFAVPVAMPMTLAMGFKWLLVGIVVAAVARAFIELTHSLSRRRGVRLPVKMFFGGVFLVLLWRLCKTDMYLGLGEQTLRQAFWDSSLPPYTFAVKLVFTAVTLGSGFLGGEVTPLFFIGACLGNALAPLLHLPLDLSVGVCMTALFGAAANAPIALIFMAIELMGAAMLPHVVVVTIVAYIALGARSIYPAQRLERHKYSPMPSTSGVALRDVNRSW